MAPVRPHPPDGVEHQSVEDDLEQHRHADRRQEGRPDRRQRLDPDDRGHGHAEVVEVHVADVLLRHLLRRDERGGERGHEDHLGEKEALYRS